MYVYLRSEPQLWTVIEDYEGGKPCYERKGKN